MMTLVVQLLAPGVSCIYMSLLARLKRYLGQNSANAPYMAKRKELQLVEICHAITLASTGVLIVVISCLFRLSTRLDRDVTRKIPKPQCCSFDR